MYKTDLKIHLIFVVKYRQKLLVNDLRDFVIETFSNISKTSDFSIDIMETDIDHIHMMISYPPTISVTSIVRKLKQISTYRLWKIFENDLKKHFWREHTFWSDGYFACSIGNASEDTVRHYIEAQG